MTTVGIVGNGPKHLLPNLGHYKNQIDTWIGADGGTITLLENGIHVDYAIGDFDSISTHENKKINQEVKKLSLFPVEKDYTDMELAIQKALHIQPKKIYVFGSTGGRLDHELINIQMLYSIVGKNVRGIIVDKNNEVELTLPGTHVVANDDMLPNISFIPFSKEVKGLTLKNFYYPLESKTISWGSTLCISNKLLSKSGTFYYEEGILLVIKSRDATL